MIATTKTVDSSELAKQLVEKSEVTSKVLAKEIQGMTDDKILFLAFPLLSSHFKVEFVRSAYEQFVQTLELRDAWDFDRLLNWFREDKVDIKDGYLQFAHPSYSESLSHILKDNGNFTAVNERILTKLLFWLVNSRVSSIEMLAAGDISVLILLNFGGFPGDPEQLLLIKLSESVEVAGLIAIASIRFYDSLPEDFVTDLLLKLAENMERAKAIAWDLIHEYDKLPEDFVTPLLLKLAEREEVAKLIAVGLVRYCDKIPESSIKALLPKLAERQGVADLMAYVVKVEKSGLPHALQNEPLAKLPDNMKDNSEQ